MTAAPAILQRFHMKKKPGRKGPVPKPYAETWEARHSRSVANHGFITVPLRDVLLILNLRLVRSDDRYTFFCTLTGELSFTHERSPGVTEWEALRSHGLLSPERFNEPARLYLKSHPRPA
jgi:hypothetical protein